jgi:hypothetical protein
MRKGRLLAISVLGVSIGAILFSCFQARRSETTVSSGLSLSDQWQSVLPRAEFRTTSTVSELFIAIPGNVHVSPSNGVVLESGNILRLEGFLTTSDGSQIHLTQNWCRLNSQTYVVLNSPLLEWSVHKYRFRSLSLRSNVPITTGKIIWLSGDPRDSKSGVITPSEN